MCNTDLSGPSNGWRNHLPKRTKSLPTRLLEGNKKQVLNINCKFIISCFYWQGTDNTTRGRSKKCVHQVRTVLRVLLYYRIQMSTMYNISCAYLIISHRIHKSETLDASDSGIPPLELVDLIRFDRQKEVSHGAFLLACRKCLFFLLNIRNSRARVVFMFLFILTRTIFLARFLTFL